MKKKAQVTSKISTKVGWEPDDDNPLYHEFVGTFYLDTVPSEAEGTYINLEERLMYINDRVVTPIVVPQPWGILPYGRWVPGNYGHDNEPDYLLQDIKRCLGLHRGEWWYQGCIAQVTLEVKTLGEQGIYRINTMVIGQDSLWGIESDCGEGYQKEVETDCLEAAKLEAREVLQTIRDMTEEEINALFDENMC